VRSWRNLKDFTRTATPVTGHSSGGLRDAENCNKPPLCALPQSRPALALTTARHSPPHQAGFLRSVDGSRKWTRTATIWRCPAGSPIGSR